MGTISFTLLLDYLYNKFAVTFILSIIGVSIREIVGNVNARQRIDISKVLASTVFTTIAMCALREYVNLSFSVYVLLCVVMSMWSPWIVSLVLNSKFMGAVLTRFIKKTLPEPISDTIEELINEEETEDTSTEKAESKTKDENKGVGG